MKKSFWLLFSSIVGSLAFSVAYFYYAPILKFSTVYYVVYAIVLAVMIVSGYLAFNQYRDEIKGIPPTDEMTRAINKEAASSSISHFLSLWIAVLLFSMNAGSAVLPICVGIIGMAIIYTGFWFYHRKKGVAND